MSNVKIRRDFRLIVRWTNAKGRHSQKWDDTFDDDIRLDDEDRCEVFVEVAAPLVDSLGMFKPLLLEGVIRMKLRRKLLMKDQGLFYGEGVLFRYPELSPPVYSDITDYRIEFSFPRRNQTLSLSLGEISDV